MSNKGLLYGILAYTMWGVLPIYWHLLGSVPPSQILVSRIIWSLIFLVILLSLRHRWSWVKPFIQQRKTLLIVGSAAILLSINWFIYIWAITAGFVIETSLGYFINPLVNVLLGTIVLKERLRTGQWLAIGVATLGVLYLTIDYGSLPWIALSLAFTFGFYGLLKKKVQLGSAESLTGEMAVLILPALTASSYFLLTGKAAMFNSNATIGVLLVGSGVVTAIPLILFAAAAQRVPLSMLGLLQYIAPTLQFLIGVFILKEPFSVSSLIGYAIIWLALILYSLEGIWQRRSQLATVSTEIPIE